MFSEMLANTRSSAQACGAAGMAAGGAAAGRAAGGAARENPVGSSFDHEYLDYTHLPAAWEAAAAGGGAAAAAGAAAGAAAAAAAAGGDGQNRDPSDGRNFAGKNDQSGVGHGGAEAAPLSYDLVYLCPPLEFVGQRRYLHAVLAFWLPYVRAGGALAGSGYYSVLAPGANVSARAVEGWEEGVGGRGGGEGVRPGGEGGSEAGKRAAGIAGVWCGCHA